MVSEITAISTDAAEYAKTYGRSDAAFTQTIAEAVEHGMTLTHLSCRPLGCPVENESYSYAMQFDDLATEQKFRIQQAVKYGHSIINKASEK